MIGAIMSGGRELGEGLSNPLKHVTEKASAIQKIFNLLTPALQLEGLDVLQGLVNSVMKKMTHGRISAVRFVPVQADNTGHDPDTAPRPPTPEGETTAQQADSPDHHGNDTHSIDGDIQPKLEIKEEPMDNQEDWPQPIEQTYDSLDFEATLHKIGNGVLPDHPIHASTPKSKTKAKQKAASMKAKTAGRGKRKLIQEKDQPAANKPGKSTKVTAADKQSSSHRDDGGGDSELDLLDDSGIGDSTMEVSRTIDGEAGQDEALSLDTEDGVILSTDTESYVDNSDSKDSDGSEYKPPTGSKNGLSNVTWSRFPPKKRKKRDTSSLPYHCDQCSFATSRKYSLDTHMSLHTGDSKHKCDDCDKVFTAASSLKRHIMLHEGVKPFHCPVCQKQFVDLAGLKTHSAVHTGERMFQCDQCTKAYTNHANLARHKRVHTGEMPYVCKYDNCDAKFRDLSSLKLHILKHTGEKPYSCPVCQKKFKTSSDFRRHERTHTQERNYKCTQCDKKFIQGYHLKQHLKIHADLWLFHCELCQKRFRTKASLQHHMKGHAGIKDYQCDLCKSSFTTKRYLNDHYIATHTKARPYKCDVCHKGFNHISNMKRHKRMHSDECKYKCKYCSRSFKYINSLQYHEGIHTGAKQMCEKCGYTCRSAFGMKNHKCGESALDRRKRARRVEEDVEDEESLDSDVPLEEELSSGEDTPRREEDTSSDSVEIVDVKQEEDQDNERRPRAAARKSGLVHTPRKSKQRAMKMIETIAEVMNTKEPKLGKTTPVYVADLQIKKIAPAKKKFPKKVINKIVSPRIKITPIIPVKPPTNHTKGDTVKNTIGVLIKQETVEIHDTNSEPDDAGKETQQAAENSIGLDDTESSTVGTKTQPKSNASQHQTKGAKQKSKAKQSKSPKNKLKVKVANTKKHKMSEPVRANGTEDWKPQEDAGSVGLLDDPSNPPSFSDVSVMQEAYGACTLTSVADDPAVTAGKPRDAADNPPATLEDLQRCMPIITQVYSVSK